VFFRSCDANTIDAGAQMSSSKNKKDKGKAIQRAEAYQLQVPTQNQFTPLQQTQFPPLPYKTAVTNPSASSSATDYIYNSLYRTFDSDKLQTSTSNKYYFQYRSKILWKSSICH